MSKNKPKLSMEEIALFSRQLTLVIESDLSLQEGLSLIGIKDQSKPLKKVVDQLIQDLNKGQSLATSLASSHDEFGDFFVKMMEIGEKSGNLSNVLDQIATTYEKQSQIRQKIKSALTYPILISVLMLAVIMVLIIYVMPMFNDILISMGGTLPPLTQGILNISLFLSRNLLWIGSILIVLIGGVVFFQTTQKGKQFFNRLSFSFPIQKDILTASLASRFALNLSLLIKSGINMMTAMDMIQTIIPNMVVQEKIENASNMLKDNKSFDQAIESMDLFPKVLVRLMTVAYGTGHLDQTLEKVAHQMNQELDYRLDRLTTVIEPLLIVILSVFVGIILLSVILPVAGIINSIG